MDVCDTPRELYANIEQPKTAQTVPPILDGHAHKLITLIDIG
jgi:hypothetical protein